MPDLDKYINILKRERERIRVQKDLIIESKIEVYDRIIKMLEMDESPMDAFNEREVDADILLRLEDRDMTRLLSKITDIEMLVKAMEAMPEELVNRIQGHMSHGRRKQVQEIKEYLNIREEEGVEALEHIFYILENMENSGEIVLPKKKKQM